MTVVAAMVQGQRECSQFVKPSLRCWRVVEVVLSSIIFAGQRFCAPLSTIGCGSPTCPILRGLVRVRESRGMTGRRRYVEGQISSWRTLAEGHAEDVCSWLS